MRKLENNPKNSLEARANALYKRIIQPGIGIPELVKGCSTEEIEKLEKVYGLPLPCSYKIFLKNFGHGFGGISYDLKFLYSSILSSDGLPLIKIAKTILNFDEECPTLPDNAFVFMERYGEQFLFFEAEKDIEDPPVFHYRDDQNIFIQIHDSIFEFWESEVEVKEKLLASRKERNKNQDKT